jgi:hypothetical protein
MTKIPFGAPGVAMFASDAYVGSDELLSGDTPRSTTTEAVAQNTNLPIFSVVGRTGNAAGGALALATADGVVKAMGITTAPVITGAGVTTTVDIYRSGMFNPNALNWDASFNTDAKKAAAFEGSVSDNIFIVKPKYQNV